MTHQSFAWLRSVLADDRKFWRLCTAVFCAFAVLKGLGEPDDWPLTQAQIDYSHGFIKRGLHGALLSALHIHHFHALSAAFFVELAVLFLLLCQFTRSAHPEARFGSYAPVAIFATSYAATFLTHIVGYTDIPLGILTVLLLLIRDVRARFWCSLFVVPLALLVHENFMLMFFPVLLFSFLLDVCVRPRVRFRRAAAYTGILIALALSINVVTSLKPHLSQPEIEQFKAEIATRVDFELRDDFFNVLSRSLSGSVREALDGFRYAGWVLRDLATLCNLLPVVLLMGHFARRLLRASGLNANQRRLLATAGLLTVLAPLPLYLLGVDGGRWNTACALDAFLVLLLLARTLKQSSFTLTQAERNAAVLVLAVNMASGMGLFQEAKITPFPFFPAMWSEFR